MSTTTPTLALTLYDSSTDQVVTFATFRAVWGGTATTSNFYKIDTWAGTVNSSISTLQSQRGAIPVSATYVSANYYEATVASITSYVTGMTILLTLDTDSAGTVTLNIGSLGTKSVMKVNSSGTLVNITSGELQSGRYYLFTYNGTQWVWVGANSSDQIYVLSYVTGNVLTAASDGSIDGTLTQSLLLSGTINNATAKTTLADSDNLGITDSAASNVLKKITWANFKTAIGTALGAIINALTGKTTPVGADVIAVGDSASSFASKLVLLSNLYKALGTGTQDATTFLRGDGSYAIPASGSSTNILLNSNFGQWTRLATPTTPVAMTDDAYNGADCWYSLIQGSNPTVARDTGIGDAQYSAKLTAGGTTNRYGIAQVRRAADSIPLRGESVVFQLLLKPVNNAGSGTRDYRVAVLEWTGTGDTVTTELVADWASSTYTTSGFFASTSKTLVGTAAVTATHNTETEISVTGTVSASCNNIIVFVWTEDVPSHASDYVLISKVGFYLGSTTKTWTPDEIEKIRTSEEVFLLTHSATGRAESTTMADVMMQFPPMRSTPTASIQGTIKMRDLSTNATRTATTPSIYSSTIGLAGMYIEITAASWSPSNFTLGNLAALMCDAGNGLLLKTGFG